MFKSLLIGILAISTTYGYIVHDTKKFDSIEKEGKKYYYGKDIKQDFKKQKKTL